MDKFDFEKVKNNYQSYDIFIALQSIKILVKSLMVWNIWYDYKAPWKHIFWGKLHCI